MVLQIIGKSPTFGVPGETPSWTGTWVILSGTGDLAGAHGQGTWWGPGFDDDEETTDTWYEGKVHIPQ